MICRHCKKEFDNNLPSCPHCGFPVDRRANPVQRKSNSQESLWLKIIAVLSALFLAASVFAVVVTVEDNKLNNKHESGHSDKKDSEDNKDNKDNNKGNANENESNEETIEVDDSLFSPNEENDFYGIYPQSEADGTVLKKLKAVEDSLSWEDLPNSPSEGIRYADYTLGDDTFRAIEMPNKMKPTEKIIRWFKFEPIQWIKVEVTTVDADGTTTTATHRISNKILDYRKFSTNDNFYGENDLNSWLNKEFHKDAFANEAEKPVGNKNYGVELISESNVTVNIRNAEPTDYARCLADINGNPSWLLLGDGGNIITDNGNIYTTNTPAGIRPFIKLDQDNQ